MQLRSFRPRGHVLPLYELMLFSASLFLVYAAAVFLIGLIASRRESEDSFMIGGRRVAGLYLVASMSATFFDGATLGVYTAYVFQYGFSAIWMFAGLVLGFFILRALAPRIKRRMDELGVYTMSEYFYRTLDRKNGLVFSLVILINYGCLLVVDLIISAQVLTSIFPLPYPLAVVIGSLVVLSYLLLAGLNAVVKTDLFQLILMVVMVFCAAGFVLGDYRYQPQEWSLFNMGTGDTVAFVILGALVIVPDPSLWQRLIAGKNANEVQRSLAWAGAPLLVMGAVISIVGLATYQAFPELPPQNALVAGFSGLLPPAIKSLGLVMLYAVSLSSTDTMTFVISAQVTRDLQNYTLRFNRSSMRRLTQVLMILCLSILTAIAIWNQDIITIGLTYAGVVIALSPVVIGSTIWRLNPGATFWSLIAGLGSVVVLVCAGAVTPASVTLCLPVTLAALIALQLVLPERTEDSQVRSARR